MSLQPLVNGSLLVVAATYGLLLTFAIAAGLIGIPLGMLVLLSLWRYGYAVLRAVAQGREDIAPPGIETMNPFGEGALIAHFLAFPMLVIWVLVTDVIGDGSAAQLLRWTAASILIATFPASAALIGLTGNLPYSLHPAHIASVIRNLGRHYVRLLVMGAGIVVLALWLQSVLLTNASPLVRLVCDVLMVWTVLAVFALTGASIAARREAFEVPAERLPVEEEAIRRLHRNRRSALDRAYASISSGLVSQGYRTLKELAADEHDSIDVYSWLFENTVDWQDKQHALQIASRLIERLLEGAQPHEALEVFARCRRLSADYRVPATSAERLLQYARSIGRHGLADELAAMVD